MNNSITIAEKGYPVHFGHSALVGLLKLAEKTKFTEIGEVINDFPADKMQDAVLVLIENGIKVHGKASDTPPTIEQITNELDRNLMLWVEVLNVVTKAIEVPETIEEGNSPPPTTKQ